MWMSIIYCRKTIFRKLYIYLETETKPLVYIVYSTIVSPFIFFLYGFRFVEIWIIGQSSRALICVTLFAFWILRDAFYRFLYIFFWGLDFFPPKEFHSIVLLVTFENPCCLLAFCIIKNRQTENVQTVSSRSVLFIVCIVTHAEEEEGWCHPVKKGFLN